MSITVRRFSPSDEMGWDEFLVSSNNGTLFHTRKFLNYSQHAIDFYFRVAVLLFPTDITKSWQVVLEIVGISQRRLFGLK